MRASGRARVLRASPLIVVAVALVLLARFQGLQLGTLRAWAARDDALLPSVAVVAGAAMVGVGAACVASGVLVRSGLLAMLAGLAWFGADVASLVFNLPVVRAFAVASTVLLVPLLVWLVRSLATGVPLRPSLRLGVIAVGAGVVAVLAASFLTYAPFDDPACPVACAFRTQIVDVDPAVRAALAVASQVVAVLAGILLVLVVVDAWRAGAARTGSRRAILVGAAVAGVGGVIQASLRLGLATNQARWASEVAWSSSIALAAGLLLVASGLGLEVVRHRTAQQRIGAIAEGMAAATTMGPLRTELAAALDDPAVDIAYPVDGVGACVDASGAPVEPLVASGRTITVLSRAGTRVALIRHRGDLDGGAIAAAFGPSLLVALDNERLRAVRLAQLRHLRESRARIIALADAERRRIDRDLHDGAQQRLLAVAFDLRLARLEAQRAGRSTAVETYAGAEALALSVVEDLRRLCHRIHPQVLSMAGIGPALVSLGDESTIPIEVEMELSDRPPIAVETAAYEVVVEALAQATARGAPALDVSVRRDADDVIVLVADGVAAPLELRTRLADRVGAVGGTLTGGVSGRGGFLRAVLPCG